jgi:hypothetical protein
MPNIKSLNPYSHVVTDQVTYGPSEIEYHISIPEKILCCLELEELPFSELNPLLFPVGVQKWTL